MKSLLKLLLPYFRPYLGKVVGAIILSACLAGIKFYQAYLIKPLFDKGLSPETSSNEAFILAGLLLLISFINIPCRYFHFFWLRYTIDKVACDLRSKAYRHLQFVPLSYFQNTKMGQQVSKIISDTHTLAIGFQGFIDFIREPLIAMAMLGLALYRDWQLTIVVLAVSPLFVVILNRTGKRVRHHQLKVQEYMADMMHNTSEGLQGQKVSKSFNLQDFIFKRFNKSQNSYFDSQMRATRVEEIASPLVEFVGAIAFAGIVIFARYRITEGHMTAGDFVSFATALALLMDPIRKFSRSNLKINQALAVAPRVQEILSLPQEVDKGTKTDIGFNRSIEFKNVSFSYGDVKILDNFSLKINKGEKTAFVGTSGGGKSTAINLLLRLYNVDKGEILIDGVNIQEFSLEAYRDLFGLVSQDIFLLHDSIENNLKVGHEFSSDEVSRSMKVANAFDFVSDLEDGLASVVGDRGTKLSGGQCQRLTIARAFLRNSPILLFDEATSALDNQSEREVQEALENVAQEKTVVSVAHRLSTVQNYDQIVVLADGKILEQGKHQELMDKGGEYSRLYQLSSK